MMKGVSRALLVAKAFALHSLHRERFKPVSEPTFHNQRSNLARSLLEHPHKFIELLIVQIRHGPK